MKVIIPLAGFGTRLRPHTYSKPKPLVNVAGKPVLGHILDKLVGLELDEVIFIVGYLGEQIQAYVDSHYKFPARYVEQKELLGQAHAIWLAREYVHDDVLIIFVDTIFETDLRAAPGADADGVLYVKEVTDPRRFGVAVVENGRVVRLVEKPETDEHRLAVIGVYYIKDSQWLMRAIDELMERDIKTKGEYYLADALQLMIEQGACFIPQEVAVWEDCGKPETVLHTNRYLLSKLQDNGHKAYLVNTTVVPPVYIAPTAQVEHSIIGPYATIADRAHVQNAIIRDSIIDEGAHIQDTMLDQSLIGKNAVVRGRFRRLNVGDSSQVDFSDAN
ncbi:MAG: NTP transferase domain-containing protein [Anaerolineae bacterium]|nr:NTP transferase domain-containing protein [Anaerolineae bacterium]